MRRSISLLGLACGVVLVLVAVSPSPVHAQVGQSSGINLYRPTLTPYLDYFRRDQGVLPNYHQFVRPRQRLLADRQRTARDIYGLAVGAQNTERRVEAVEARGTGRRSTYMNYLHFYPGATGARSR